MSDPRRDRHPTNAGDVKVGVASARTAVPAMLDRYERQLDDELLEVQD